MAEHLGNDVALSNAIVATAFVIYWVAGLQKALICLRAYTMRSLVVLAYTIWALRFGGEFVFNVEWVAWSMVLCHWLGAVTNAVYPDPRFRRKYVRARP